MGFIEKAEAKIQKIKKKREQRELIKNFKKHLEEPLDGFVWRDSENLLGG